MTSELKISKIYAVLVPHIELFRAEYAKKLFRGLKIKKIEEDDDYCCYKISSVEIAEKIVDVSPLRFKSQQEEAIREYVRNVLNEDHVPVIALMAFGFTKFWLTKRDGGQKYFEEETGFKLPLKGYKIEND